MKTTPNLLKALFCSTFALLFASSASATNITIEGYVLGSAALELNGDLETGVIFDTISAPAQDTDSSWHGNQNTDYISFVDDSTTNGFYITLYVSDLTYTGNSPTQQALEATNIKFIGTISGGTTAPPTLNLLPESCSEATSEKFTFHASFMDPETDYKLTANNFDQVLLTSSTTCLVVGRLGFDKITMTYPGGTEPGSYSAEMIFTMHDGLPEF